MEDANWFCLPTVKNLRKEVMSVASVRVDTICTRRHVILVILRNARSVKLLLIWNTDIIILHA